ICPKPSAVLSASIRSWTVIVPAWWGGRKSGLREAKGLSSSGRTYRAFAYRRSSQWGSCRWSRSLQLQVNCSWWSWFASLPKLKERAAQAEERPLRERNMWLQFHAALLAEPARPPARARMWLPAERCTWLWLSPPPAAAPLESWSKYWSSYRTCWQL